IVFPRALGRIRGTQYISLSYELPRLQQEPVTFNVFCESEFFIRSDVVHCFAIALIIWAYAKSVRMDVENSIAINAKAKPRVDVDRSCRSVLELDSDKDKFTKPVTQFVRADRNLNACVY